MKFTSPVYSAVSGSVAGLTYSHNRFGMYTRSRSVPVNPASTLQVFARTAFADAAAEWSMGLSEAQRLGWRNYAAATSWVDALGETVQLTGQQMFSRQYSLASMAFALGGTFSDFAVGFWGFQEGPVTAGLPTPPAVGGVTIETDAGPPITETLGGITVAADHHLLVFLSRPQPATVTFFRGPYVLSAYATGATVATDVGDATVSPYGLVVGAPQDGQLIWGYARVVDPEGRVSTRARFGPITVAAA